MDLFEAIKKRHSYREAFKDDPVPRSDLQKIVQAGIQAPSGCNAQTTSFIIVDDPIVLDQIRSLVSGKAVATAPAMIIALYDERKVYKDMSFFREDYAAAVENMLLAITALGYATVWIDGALRREERAESIAKLLDVPDHLTVGVVLPIGIPLEKIEQKEKLPFQERAWFNRYKK